MGEGEYCIAGGHWDLWEAGMRMILYSSRMFRGPQHFCGLINTKQFLLFS